jgi:serine/threonine-protein kinase
LDNDDFLAAGTAVAAEQSFRDYADASLDTGAPEIGYTMEDSDALGLDGVDDLNGEDFYDNDNTPTNILSASQLETLKASTHGLNSGYNDGLDMLTSDSNTTADKKKSKKRLRIALIGVIGVLTCILIGATIFWYHIEGPGSKVQIPVGLVGESFENIQGKLTDAQIKFSRDDAFSDTVEAGKIISTSPKSGDLISKYNGNLKVVVSKGVEILQVPANILGKNITEGVELVKKAGFPEPKVVHEYRQDAPKNVIVEATPEPGSGQRHDTVVTLTVSDGPRPVVMPNVVGSATADAVQALQALGLGVNKQEVYSDDVEAGKVISQSVAANTGTFEGSSVTLTVSLGSELVTVPDVKGMDVQKARSTIATADLKYAESGEAVLGLVQRQSVAGGTKVKRGTVITIQIV